MYIAADYEHLALVDILASRSHAFSGEEKAWCTAYIRHLFFRNVRLCNNEPKRRNIA